MQDKVVTLLAQLPELETKMSDPQIISNQKEFKEITEQHSYLTQLKNFWEEYQKLTKQKEDNEALLKETQDEEFLSLLQEDQKQVCDRIEELEKKIEDLLVPPDPLDSRNTIVEIRAGTGGDEAAIFVDCLV